VAGPEPSDRTNPQWNRRERAANLRRRAWALRARGNSTRVIAARLGISQTWALRLLRQVEDRIAAETEAVARRVRARQACQIEHLLSEVMEAWEYSKRHPGRTAPKATAATKPGGDTPAVDTPEAADPAAKAAAAARVAAGDVRFIAEARALLDAERKLWGLDTAPDDARGLDVESLFAGAFEILRHRRADRGTPG
jgi:hypothetical protein